LERKLDVSGCRSLVDNWLPDSSVARLHTLRQLLQCICDCRKSLLVDLQVEGCRTLAEGWLLLAPGTAWATWAWAKRCSSPPEGMGELQELSVCGCAKLANDWRTACSAAEMLTLHVTDGGYLVELPGGLSSLCDLGDDHRASAGLLSVFCGRAASPVGVCNNVTAVHSCF
jgi:hypothetical protein